MTFKDIFSYNVEQARGDTTHNMVPVVMAERNIDVQEAVDFVGYAFLHAFFLSKPLTNST